MKSRQTKAKKRAPCTVKTVVEGNVQIYFEAVSQIEIDHLLAAAFAGMRRYYETAPLQATEPDRWKGDTV